MSKQLKSLISFINKTPYISFILFIFFCALNYIHIIFYSVEVPFMDEWELFRANSFVNNPNIENLFTQHNEHKLVIPKIFFYLFSLMDFNVKACLTINYIIFSLSILLIFKKFKLTNFNLIIWSLVLFSPLNFENNLWPFQIQWHILILFIILSIIMICKNKKTSLDYLMGVLLPFSAIFSLGSGAIAMLVLSGFSFLRTYKITNSSYKISHFKFSIFYFISFIISSIIYFYNYQKPPYHPKIIPPWSAIFWEHFSSILSLGTGNINITLVFIIGISIFILILNAFKTALKLYFKEKNTPFLQEELFLLIFAFTAMLASISMSRAGFGATQGFSSRYFEFSAYNTLAIISLSYSPIYNNLKKVVLILVVLLTLNNLNFKKFYEPAFNQRKSGKDCLREVIELEKDKVCPEIYPESLLEVIKYTKKNNKNYIFLN